MKKKKEERARKESDKMIENNMLKSSHRKRKRSMKKIFQQINQQQIYIHKFPNSTFYSKNKYFLLTGSDGAGILA
jgi:hypothetical protein